MKVFICEDSQKDLNKLKSYIGQYFNKHDIEYVIQEFFSAEQLINNIEVVLSNQSLVFLDIYMKELSGMDVAKVLYNNSFSGSIVFTTSSPDFAVESYKVNADGYLCKPYNYNDFEHTMNRCQNKLEMNLKYIEIISERLKYKILLKDIIFIETGNHCSYIHTITEVFKSSQKISELNLELEKETNFLKLNRSFIVNLNMIDQVRNNDILMKNNENIQLPVRQKTKIKQTIAEYYWNMARN